jgi:hypothetical protein
VAEGDLPENGKGSGNIMLRIGLASALGVGALVTGFILTRPGRKLMSDVIAGRKRTHLEGRVLDALWSDRLLGPREIEVRETGPVQVSLSGELVNGEEVGRAVALAERAKGVKQVESKMTIAPRPPKRRSTD